MSRWTVEQAKTWQVNTGWLIGMNYLPNYAVNSTEMWFDDTFDGETIRKELLAALEFGFNICRVFLPFIVWENQREVFMKNFECFLDIADHAGLKIIPVLFDDCAFSGKEPYLGKQNEPVKGIHNSGWTPSPGSTVADDPLARQRLASYVKDIVSTHRHDSRIAIWDIYNEPGNNNRKEKSLDLLYQAFGWARDCTPIQPLTAGIWTWKPYDLVCIELSDIISFHDYLPLSETEERVRELKKTDRPLICTEWLHRQNYNKVESHLPFFYENNISAICWGFVQGKTQTHLSWDKKRNKNDGQPDIWQHDLLYTNGQVYDTKERGMFFAYAEKGKQVVQK